MMIINSPFFEPIEADSHNRIGLNFGYGSISKLKPAKKHLSNDANYPSYFVMFDKVQSAYV